MKFLRRLAVALLLVLLVGGVGLYIAARYYLSSHAVTAQVSTRLGAMLGAPVQVDSADVGVTGASALHGLRIFEPGASAEAAPIVTVDGASADVSALDLLAGKTPNEVTLDGASIALRFDAGGKLVTHLPKPETGGGPMPRVKIDNGKLTLSQEGRPPMVIQGVTGELTSAGPDLKVEGKVVDPFWGDWALNGSLTNATGAVDLRLAAQDVAVDKARLTGLPFIPPEVWREVMVEGKTPCNFNLGLTLADNPAIHYRVECAPADAKVHVASIHLDAEHASGKVVVDDNLVQLRDVHGRFAGGEIATAGDLDFRQAAWVLTFAKVSVQKVVWDKLPADWVDALLPEPIRRLDPHGDLTGEAMNIRVSLEGGQVQVTGDGHGQIDNAVIAGSPTSEPIRLKLGAKNGKLHYVTQNPTPRLLATVLVAALQVAPPAEAVPAAPPFPVPPSMKPTDLAGWLPNAAVWATDRATGALGKGVSTVGNWLSPPPAGLEPAPEYLTLDLALQDVDLGQLLQRLEFKLPFPLEGKLSVKVHASIPVNTPQDMKNYRLSGTANLPRVNVAGVEMTDVQTDVRLENGILELRELKGKAASPKGGAGSFQGTARMQIAPLGDLSGDLRVDRFPLEGVLNLLPAAGGAANGVLSGHVELHAPSKTLTDPATWNARGNLSSDRLEAYGLALTAASVDLSLDGGTARATGLKATFEKAALSGDAQLQLSGSYAYAGTLSLAGADLAAMQQLSPDVRPPFPVGGTADVTAELRGTLSPLTVAAAGTASSSDLSLDKFQVDKLSFKWDVDGDRIKVTGVDAALYRGKITGSAVVPLRPAGAGEVNLDLADVDVQALSKSLPAVPVRLQGQASGSVKATLPPAGPGGDRQATGKIDLSAKALRVQNIPTDNLHADVDYKAGQAEYHLTGNSLGGRFTLDGKVPLGAEKKAPAGGAGAQQPEASSGHFRFEQVQLSRLWDPLGLKGSLGQVRGRATLDLPFRLAGPELTPTGTGTISVRNLSMGDALLTENLTADLVLKDQTVQIRNLSASLGEGNISGAISYNYRTPEQSYFRFRLEQVDAAALLASAPDVASQVQGPVDLNLRGTLGHTWRGSGEATLTRGRVYGAVVDEWHVPVDFEFSPTRGSGDVNVRDSSAQLAGGRATVQAELHWSGGEAPRLEGSARFNNAALRSLVSRSGELGSYLVGRLTGRVDFGADSLRSADDLNATVDATLSQSQALQTPVLSVLVPFVAPGQSATTFNSGDIHGRLSRGVFRIQRLTLSSRIVRMAVIGNVTTQGRLDLDVTASTSLLGINPAFLQTLGLRIPAVGPIPVGVILEASAYLSNRVVSLRVTGTTRSPNVQVQPVQLLAEEAVRFFVLQSGAPVP